MNDSRKTKKQLIEELETLRRKLEELEKREETSLMLIQHPTSMILRIDRDGNVIFLNDFAQSFFGYFEDELLGKNLVDTVIPSDEESVARFRKLIDEAANHPDRYVSADIENRCSGSENVWISWRFRALTDEEGTVSEILCLGNDITRQKYVEDELKRVTETDLLTGILTQRSFIEKFENERYRFGRSGNTFVLVIGVINNFRDGTDAFTSEIVDFILIRVAETWKMSLRRSDIEGRWAGEEFVALLPETNLQGGIAAMDKILGNLNESVFQIDGTETPVTMTLCVGLFDHDMELREFIDMAYGCLDELEPEKENRIVTVDTCASK